MSSRLKTGIELLDRELEGGIPAGSIIAFTAEPASQSELLLYELTSTRGTLYLSAGRSEEAVRDGLERTPVQTGNPTIRHVGAEGEPLDQAQQLIRALPETANLIVDPADVLEQRDQERYRHFLNELQTQMVNTGGLAILHCLSGHDPPHNRDFTKYMADVVFELETKLNGDKLENRLTVPKFRGGGALTEAIKLDLVDTVAIDPSRDIA